MSSRYRLIDSPKGRGTVEQRNRSLAQVDYSLSVKQEQVVAGNEMLQGHLEVDGVLSGRSTWEDLEGDDPLTLLLADGRRLDFLFIDSRRGRIKGTGDFY